MLDTALNQHTPPPLPPPPRGGGFFSPGSRRGRGGAPSTSSRTSRHPPQPMPGSFTPQQYYAPQHQYPQPYHQHPQHQYPQPHYIPQPPYIPQPHYYPRGHRVAAGPSRVQYAPPQRSHPCVVCEIKRNFDLFHLELYPLGLQDHPLLWQTRYMWGKVYREIVYQGPTRREHV